MHQALQRFYDQAPYVVLYLQDTVEAYRNDRFTGFVRQPAETGPVIYTQSDPSYSLIKPISGDDRIVVGRQPRRPRRAATAAVTRPPG